MNTEILGIIWLTLFLIVGIISLTLFYKLRNEHVLIERVPSIVCVANIVISLYIIALCVSQIYNDVPCIVRTIFATVGTIILCNVYTTRCFVLFFRHNLAVLQTKFRGITELEHDVYDVEEEDHEAQEGFFFKYKHYMKEEGPICKAVLCFSLLLMIPCAIAIAVDDEMHEGSGTECARGWLDDVVSAYVCAYALGFIYFGYHLRDVHDPFFIKRELQTVGFVCTPSLIVWYLFNHTYKSTNSSFPFSTLVLLVSLTVCFILSILFPCMSYRKQLRATMNTVTVITELDDVLANKKARNVLKMFLAQEFNVENLLFWEDVSAYRYIKDRKVAESALKQFAILILRRYILDGSPLEVNLSAESKQLLIDSFKTTFGSTEDIRLLHNSNGTESWSCVTTTPWMNDCASLMSSAKSNLPPSLDLPKLPACQNPEDEYHTKLNTIAVRKASLPLQSDMNKLAILLKQQEALRDDDDDDDDDTTKRRTSIVSSHSQPLLSSRIQASDSVKYQRLSDGNKDVNINNNNTPIFKKRNNRIDSTPTNNRRTSIVLSDRRRENGQLTAPLVQLKEPPQKIKTHRRARSQGLSSSLCGSERTTGVLEMLEEELKKHTKRASKRGSKSKRLSKSKRESNRCSNRSSSKTSGGVVDGRSRADSLYMEKLCLVPGVVPSPKNTNNNNDNDDDDDVPDYEQGVLQLVENVLRSSTGINNASKRNSIVSTITATNFSTANDYDSDNASVCTSHSKDMFILPSPHVSSIFDTACLEVYNLIKNDPFPRFRNSTFYMKASIDGTMVKKSSLSTYLPPA